jgi:hypothetical protein
MQPFSHDRGGEAQTRESALPHARADSRVSASSPTGATGLNGTTKRRRVSPAEIRSYWMRSERWRAKSSGSVVWVAARLRFSTQPYA